MKLFRILPLVVGSAAAGILASTSPAHALDFNFSFSDSSDPSKSVSGTVYGLIDGTSSATSVSFISNLPGDFRSTFVSPSPTIFINQFTVVNGSVTDYLYVGYSSDYNVQLQLIPGGTAESSTYYSREGFTYNIAGSSEDLVSFSPASADVPFDIPGGATIPALGSLLALSAMRKVRHSIASKTRIAKPVTATVS